MRIPPGRDFLFAGLKLREPVRAMRAGFGVVAFACLLSVISPAMAQQDTTLPVFASKKNDPNAQMLLQADEILYNNDAKNVTASGHVQIFYDGYNVVAQKVVYYQATRRVVASGDVRVTDKVGNVYYSDNADITENFSDGFIRSLRMERIDNTHLAADSAERRDGNITIFNRGVYTACEPCKDHPEKPPLWQVKAARVISNQKEQTIYFEDATVEFFGMPVAYIPYFWTPDGSVKRKSGFLAPSFFSNRRIGTGIATPYYFALSPFYDVTYTPTFIVPRGVHHDLLWRQSLPNGGYTARLTGIYQFNADNVGVGEAPPAPLLPDAGAEDWRGSFQTTGRFLLTDKWTFGWNATWDSDPRYLKDYGYVPLSKTENISTVYLQGKGERSFFDARSYYFRTLVDINTDLRERQEIQPIVAPVVDYNTAMADPVFGGEFRIDANLTHLAREEQLTYQVPLTGQFLTPGFAGDYTRLSLNAQWRKTFTDNIGQRFTPFAGLRGDIYRYDVANTTAQLDVIEGAPPVSAATTPISLATVIPSLVANEDDLIFRGMPMIGMDYRYPFIATQGNVTHLFEPIAQIIVRPNETRIGELPNEDAHSIVYDDTNLFEFDKFSGYDRIEGGTRANVGAQYTLQTTSGFRASALFGQSYHLSGVNSFAQGTLDVNGTGLDSGLETDDADYVARLYLQPWKHGDVAARFRFDESSWNVERLELDGRFYYGPIFTSFGYTRIAEQPLLGINTPLEEVSAYGSYNLTDAWSVYGGSRYSIQNATDNEGFVSNQLGLRYTDECFTVSLDYTRIYRNYGDLEPQGQIMLRFNLRTLGDGNLATRVGPQT
ncbi:MAG: LPS-assembly protein LptD [Pseudomonadota bacterium]